MAAGDLVLLTGASGHLGFRVLLYTLKQGYHVLAAVRSQAKADIITSNAALKALNRPSQLSFVIVPDFLAENAFDDAVQGTKYIIHVASPIASKDPEDGDYNKYFIQPAIRGTLGVLESASKASTVKRIVITSSILALTGADLSFGAEKIWKSTDRQSFDKGPYPSSFHAYAVSKVAALNETDAWMKEYEPSFDVINICPGFIFGRDELCDSTAYFQTGTNRLLLAIALGFASPETAFPVAYNHVNDTALPHVLALDPKIAGNQSFILSSSGEKPETWDDILNIVEKGYPEQVKSGVFKKAAAWKSAPVWKADVESTKAAFGIKLADLEETTKSVLDHFVELLKKEQGQ